MIGPTVSAMSALAMQVCVPKEWTDQQVRDFAEKMNPCGTQGGWHIRYQGDPDLAGAPERAVCELDADQVHIMLGA
jgi:hypothetical protein